jgi:hypothetical protein
MAASSPSIPTGDAEGMLNHPSITHQIAAAHRQDLLDAAARHRLARSARAERPVDRRRPALNLRPREATCACR